LTATASRKIICQIGGFYNCAFFWHKSRIAKLLLARLLFILPATSQNPRRASACPRPTRAAKSLHQEAMSNTEEV